MSMDITPVIWEDNKVKLIDQTKLPLQFTYIICNTYEEIAAAIKTMKVRGAPAIGIAAAMGYALGILNVNTEDKETLKIESLKIKETLLKTRPTAVNLFWALKRMEDVLNINIEKSLSEIKQILIKESILIFEEDLEMNRKIGKQGASLIKEGDTILTHCNAGGLATSGYGTALGVIYSAVERGKNIKVYVDETRPLLQGARLTTFELHEKNIDVTIICDNTVGWLMKQGKVNCVIVGADRIVSNGDTANKIGTYSLSVLAKQHNIPFYVVALSSTFDFNLKSGAEIPIEERNELEVLEPFGSRIAPYGINTYNPAFDITPAENITAIVTEKKIFFYPYEDSLRDLL